jgi:hypothetical protein
MLLNATETNWIAIGASLAGGGAVGAIITAVVTSIRNRKQPVAYRVEVVPVFKGGMFPSDVLGSLSLQSATAGYGLQIPNLSIANIELVNSGNKDYSSFRVGFTLSEGDAAVICRGATPDRHHEAQILTQLGPGAPAANIDCILSPFNRQDLYKFTLYIVARQTAEAVGQIQLGSPEPVIFKQTPTMTQIAAQAAKGLVAGIGPFEVRIR